MSLDVYLFRERWISYDCGETYTEEREVIFSANITHNLNEMASKAGIYDALWRPYRLHKEYSVEKDDDYKFEESAVVLAKEIAPLIQKGLEDMILRPKYYKQFNPSNGWGSYDHFIPWIKNYLTACLEHPDSIVDVSR